jgi:hypothetical protein
MKNLITAVCLLFALAANAQTKKINPTKQTTEAPVLKEKISNEAAAKKNVTDLNNFTPLTPERQAVFQELFTTKFKMLNDNGDLSSERKAYVSQIIARKIEASLDAPTFEKVKANTTLFSSLIN